MDIPTAGTTFPGTFLHELFAKENITFTNSANLIKVLEGTINILSKGAHIQAIPFSRPSSSHLFFGADSLRWQAGQDPQISSALAFTLMFEAALSGGVCEQELNSEALQGADQAKQQTKRSFHN